MEDQNQDQSQNQVTQVADKGMNKGLIIGIVVVLVLVVGGFFVLNKNKTTELETTIQEGQSSPVNGNSQGQVDSQVQEIVVEGTEFSYSPGEINIQSGQTVRIIFKNVGKMEHDLVIDELSLATEILNPGDEQVLQFVADTPGTFSFYCSVGSHRALGMEGTLTVE